MLEEIPSIGIGLILEPIFADFEYSDNMNSVYQAVWNFIAYVVLLFYQYFFWYNIAPISLCSNNIIQPSQPLLSFSLYAPKIFWENIVWSDETGRRTWCSRSVGITSKAEKFLIPISTWWAKKEGYHITPHRNSSPTRRTHSTRKPRRLSGRRRDERPPARRELRAGVRPLASWAGVRLVPSLAVQGEGPFAYVSWGSN